MAEKVADIRKDLVELGLTEQEAKDIKTRANLIAKRAEILANSDIEIEADESLEEEYPEEYQEEEYTVEYPEVENLEDGFEEFEDGLGDEIDVVYEDDELTEAMDRVEQVKSDVKQLERGSEGWSDYVMSLFTDDELIEDVNGGDKVPCLAGLSRVANQMFDIEVSKPVETQTGMYFNHPAATVTYLVIATNKTTLNRYEFGAVADAWIQSMGKNETFNVHAAAIAESRAESRALKKLLDLRNVVAYEEISKTGGKSMGASVFDEAEEKDDEPLTDKQKLLIETKCKEFGIDLYKFINKQHFEDPESNPEPLYVSLEDVSRKVAGAMATELRRYQTCEETSKEIPESILEDE